MLLVQQGLWGSAVAVPQKFLEGSEFKANEWESRGQAFEQKPFIKTATKTFNNLYFIIYLLFTGRVEEWPTMYILQNVSFIHTNLVIQ